MNIPEGLPTSGMIQEAFAEAMNRRLAVGIDDITAILKTALAAAPTSPAGDLPRYGIKWQGPQEPICVPMEDGYWTPWHLAVNETPPAQEAVDRMALREKVIGMAWDVFNNQLHPIAMGDKYTLLPWAIRFTRFICVPSQPAQTANCGRRRRS